MQIEKNIPMPLQVRGAPRKYPFYDMDVGDSVFFPSVSSTASNEYRAAINAGRNHGMRFSARNIDGGLRIWRIG